MACVMYHRDRLAEIETAMRIVIEAHPEVISGLKAKGGAMAGGNTRKLDFEYQAFVLAVRRCLEYVAAAVAAYFKQELHSFKDLVAFLEQRTHGRVAAAEVLRALREVRPRYERFVFDPKPGERTVRNDVAHFRYVSAGCLNVNGLGIALSGRELKSFDTSALATRLGEHAADLEASVAAILSALRQGDALASSSNE